MLTNLWRRFTALVSLLWREVAKFGTVGGVAFIIDSAVFLFLLSGPMAGSEVKAKIVAGIVATVFSYVANRLWTFRHRRQRNVLREVVLFIVMNAIGLGIQAACVFIAKYAFDVTSTTGVFIAGNVIGLFFGTVFRYFAYRFWVFSEEMDADPNFAQDRELLTGDLPVIQAPPAAHSRSVGEHRGQHGNSASAPGDAGSSDAAAHPEPVPSARQGPGDAERSPTTVAAAGRSPAQSGAPPRAGTPTDAGEER